MVPIDNVADLEDDSAFTQLAESQVSPMAVDMGEGKYPRSNNSPNPSASFNIGSSAAPRRSTSPSLNPLNDVMTTLLPNDDQHHFRGRKTLSNVACSTPDAGLPTSTSDSPFTYTSSSLRSLLVGLFSCMTGTKLFCFLCVLHPRQPTYTEPGSLVYLPSRQPRFSSDTFLPN